MRGYRLRTDLQRARIGDFSLPLGIVPREGAVLKPPAQGYTVAYSAGQDDEPDAYSFHVVISHERLAPLLRKSFDLLADQVYGIVEIGSRDAYRSTDVFIGESDDPMSLDQFKRLWSMYEPFLLEDGSIAAGANSEDPHFVEIFLDQWKGLSIHVPLSMRDEVEDLLHAHGLEEVPQTWHDDDDGEGESGHDVDPSESTELRAVLDLADDDAPDLDELLLSLRHDWKLELNVDPDNNVDEAGRALGATLWHAVVIVDRAGPNGHHGHATADGAYASIWATADSLVDMQRLISLALEQYPDWEFGEIYTIDRVAFDERPDELADLRPNTRQSMVHLVNIEPWGPAPGGAADDDDAGDKGDKS